MRLPTQRGHQTCGVEGSWLRGGNDCGTWVRTQVPCFKVGTWDWWKLSIILWLTRSQNILVANAQGDPGCKVSGMKVSNYQFYFESLDFSSLKTTNYLSII